jgi:hypothetical protein
VLMHLGLLATVEAAQGVSHQLSLDAKIKGVSDGNAGLVADQLRAEHIPKSSKNIRVALKQYLRYLAPPAADPFLPLLDGLVPKKEVLLLSADAVQYFEQLCAKDFADAWMELDKRLKEFLKAETRKGRNFGGTGFAVRVSNLYEDDLVRRTQTIVENLKKVHRDFGSPLINGIDEQLKRLGVELLAQQFYGLEGACSRYLSRLGVTQIASRELHLKYALQLAWVANQINQYIWVLRKVPMKSPDQLPVQPTFVINGNVGAIQTAPNAVAHVHQQVGERDFSVLNDALMQLRHVASEAHGIDTNQRDLLIAYIAATEVEIKREVKDETALLTWLTGIGGMVQTLGSAQAAWDTVRMAARFVGLSL